MLNMVCRVWVWEHNRNKSEIPTLPIVSSTWRAFRYHLGTVAKGSFIITLVKIPRLILTYLHSQLKGKVGVRLARSRPQQSSFGRAEPMGGCSPEPGTQTLKGELIRACR